MGRVRLRVFGVGHVLRRRVLHQVSGITTCPATRVSPRREACAPARAATDDLDISTDEQPGRMQEVFIGHHHLRQTRGSESSSQLYLLDRIVW